MRPKERRTGWVGSPQYELEEFLPHQNCPGALGRGGDCQCRIPLAGAVEGTAGCDTENIGTFPEARSGDVHQANSSQALAIGVFGTIKVPPDVNANCGRIASLLGRPPLGL